MTYESIFYWLSIFGIVLFGVLVLLRQRKPVFVNYSIFSFSLALWLVCQLFASPHSNAKLWLGLGFIAIDLLVSAFLLFAYSYENNKKFPKKYIPLLLVPIILFGGFSFSSLMASPVTNSSGVLILNPGSLYYVQNAVLLVYLGIGVGILSAKYKNFAALQKNQLLLILGGFCQFLIVNIVAGLIFINNSPVQTLRPISALVMVGIISYTVAFRKLFDIRLIVLRALVYISTVASLGFIYGFVVFGFVGKIIFKNHPFNTAEQIVYTLLAVILAFTFQPIQRFFNKITNRLFYRDGYDSQKLLDELGSFFAQEINFDKLTHRTVRTLAQQLKLTYAALLVSDGSKSKFRLTLNGKAKYINRIDAVALSSLKHKVTVIDYEETPNSDLADHNVAMVVRLVTQEGVVGYLLLGSKQNGAIFNGQDIDIMTIVSNSLAIAIQNTLLFERINNFNLTLQEEVSQATKKLRRTNEKLKELDETKDDFISMASHQLRTPLTSVKGYLSMILEEDAGKINHMQREMLGQAFFSSQRMVYLIADLLNVSRLKAGKFIIDATSINLANMVQQELEQLEETAASRSLTLQYDKPDNFPDLMMDETKTRQVIMNFVDNAIYYTPSGGHIVLRLINNPETIELRVEDDGIGVPRDEQPHLFTKFYRAGNARKARPDGTGLGLYMAKKVIVAQGGSTIFQSQEGKGSTFGFIFPKAKLSVSLEHAVLPIAKEPVKEPSVKS
jgi:signal transduction histidine kinase